MMVDNSVVTLTKRYIYHLKEKANIVTVWTIYLRELFLLFAL